MLEGQVALVTGSSRGVGRAIALELAGQGADVGVHCNRSLDEAYSVAKRITAMGRRAVVVNGDTRKPADVERFIEEVHRKLGGTDILVNNAAYALLKPFMEISPTEWQDQVNSKAVGYYLTARAVLPGMLERGRGVIINILSTVGVRGGRKRLRRRERRRRSHDQGPGFRVRRKGDKVLRSAADLGRKCF